MTSELIDQLRKVVSEQLLQKCRATLLITDPNQDLDRLQREIDDARADVNQGLKGNIGLDAGLPGADKHVVLGLSLSLASQLTKDQMTAFRAESVGAAGGLVVGNTLGRKHLHLNQPQLGSIAMMDQ